MNTAAIEPASRPAPLGTRISIGVVLVLFIGVFVFASVAPLVPPDPVPANASPAEFSSA